MYIYILILSEAVLPNSTELGTDALRSPWATEGRVGMEGGGKYQAKSSSLTLLLTLLLYGPADGLAGDRI